MDESINESKQRMKEVIALLEAYKLRMNTNAQSIICKSLERYSPQVIQKAGVILLRNEDHFSVKRLTDIIHEFDLEPETSEIVDTQSVPIRDKLGMTVEQESRLLESCTFLPDGGDRLLEELRINPENFHIDRTREEIELTLIEIYGDTSAVSETVEDIFRMRDIDEVDDV